MMSYFKAYTYTYMVCESDLMPLTLPASWVLFTLVVFRCIPEAFVYNRLTKESDDSGSFKICCDMWWYLRIIRYRLL